MALVVTDAAFNSSGVRHVATTSNDNRPQVHYGTERYGSPQRGRRESVMG